ncbi:MAG: AzlC family ABC transporter permease [Acidimicrobiales bacterium]
MPSSTLSDRRRFPQLHREALRDSVPLLVPAIPFGFVLGVEINDSLMPVGVGFSTSVVVFAGAAQLALITLAGTVSTITVVLTALVINARHVMYSAAIAPAMARQPTWFRVLGPFFLIDQAFALSIARSGKDPREFRHYYLTCAALFFPMWQIVTLLGIVFGAAVPDSLGLGIAPALMFTGIVVAMVVDRASLIAATTAVVVTMFTLDLPNRSGLLVGALAGVTAGFFAEERSSR